MFYGGHEFRGWLHPDSVQVVLPGQRVTITGTGIIELFALFDPTDSGMATNDGERTTQASAQHPNITNPSFNGQVIARQNLQVRWNSVPGATSYRFSLRNTTFDVQLYNNLTVNALNFTIGQARLVEGQHFRVAVASVIGGVLRWTERTFSVQPVIQAVTVTGTARVGSTLSANVNHPGANNPALVFQWQRYAGNNVWNNIGNATGRTFVPAATDFIRVMVRGTGSPLPTTWVISNWVQVRPVDIQSVTITGTPSVGSTLTANVVHPGVSNPALRFQWQRYAGSNVWNDIHGATNRTYVPTLTDRFVRVVVSGTGSPVSTDSRTSDWVTIRRLTISANSWIPGGEGGTITVNVTSNTTWNIPTSNAPAWLTISNVTPANRTNDGSFRVNVTPNTGSAHRVGTVTIRSSDGSMTQTVTVTQPVLPIVTLNYDIFVNQGETFGNTGFSTVVAQSLVDDVTPAFMNTFRIRLTRHNTSRTHLLNERPGCVLPVSIGCMAAFCGPADRCQSEHHRSGEHFLNVHQGNRTRNHFMFVNYGLCFFDEDEGVGRHRGVGGLAHLLGNTMIVSSPPHAGNMRQITAHEISHLFGAEDERNTPCTPGQPCVMRWGEPRHDRWCEAHRAEIFANRNR